MNFRIYILVAGLLFVTGLLAQTSPDSLPTTPFTGEAEPVNMGWLLFKTMGVLVLIISLILVLVIVGMALIIAHVISNIKAAARGAAGIYTGIDTADCLCYCLTWERRDHSLI